MTKEERIEVSIKNVLSILEAWSEGRITVTRDKDDMLNSVYSINTIINIITNETY